MKILHIINSIDDEHGGPAVHVKNLANALCKCGHETEIYACDGLPIRRPHQYYYNPQIREKLSRDAVFFDVVHIHGIWTYPDFIASKLCYEFGIPYIITSYGMLDKWCMRQKRIKKYIYYFFIEKKILKKAAFIHFSFEDEHRKSIIYNIKRNFKYIQYLINFKDIEESDNEPGYGLINKKYILFFGRIHKKKGWGILIKAFLKLRKEHKYKNIHLVFMGKGKRPLQDDKNNIIDLGMIYGKERFSIVKNALFVCLPSYQENFGLSIVESLACGIPVLISKYIDIADLIVKNKVGVVCDIDVLSLSEAMKEMIRLKEDKNSALRAKEFAYKEFGWEKIVNEYTRMYQEAIAINNAGKIRQ